MTRTWQSALAALAIMGAAVLAGAPPALAQSGGGGGGGPDPTTATSAERVSAEVLPGVMQVQVAVHAYMRELTSGETVEVPDFTLSCTGFAVSPNGVIATAGHCVNEQDLLDEVADKWAQEDEAQGYAYEESYNLYKNNFKLEGTTGGSPPDRTISVVSASSNINQAGPVMQAQIVDQKSNAQGDVALLKVDATNLSTIEVAPSDAVNTGTAIMSVGYPASRDKFIDLTLAPSWKDGTVSSRQNINGVPFLEITSEMGHGMSGGPTVNQQGQVVGVNSGGTADGANSFNLVAPSSALFDMMARNGIRSEAGPIDVAYRSGLDDYFAGRYSDAAGEFQQVLDMQPENKMASEYKSKALAAYNQFGDKGSLGLLGWLLVGAGAFLVLVVGGVILVVSRSRRRRAATAAQQDQQQMDDETKWPGQQWAPDRPVAASHGYGGPVPTPRTGEESMYGPAGSPGDRTTHPQSAAVGLPIPTTGSAGSTMTVAGSTASGRGSAPTATVTASDERVAGDAPPNVEDSATPLMGFCPYCGKPRASEARSCGGCGHQL